MIQSPEGVEVFSPDELVVIYASLKQHRRVLAAQMGVMSVDASHSIWERTLQEFDLVCQLIRALRPHVKTEVTSDGL